MKTNAAVMVNGEPVDYSEGWNEALEAPLP